MTWQQRSLILGGVAGGASAALALASSAGLGPVLGGCVGTVLAAILGGAATLAAVHTFETQVRAHLAAVAHDAEPPAPFGDDELDGLLDTVRLALRQAGDAASESAEAGNLALDVWTAVHGPPAPGAPAPDPRRSVTALIEMFRKTADALRRYAAALEEANERMASGALDQSETVSRTATTVEALSEKIDQISQNAESASEACERARQEARRGLEQVHRVIEGMDRLRARIDVNSRKARRLGDRSVEIGTIVELIRGISSRTDMLALNATIESVRAGEHGRGFAVVAEEIRKLAERTATATRDIGTLVEAIQADTHESIRALGEEQTEMEQESQRVRDAGQALERISQMAEHSAQLVEGISRSSNDQVTAAQDLVKAMQRITDVSHLTLERTTESRAAIRGLTGWCERLAPLSLSSSSSKPAPDTAARTPVPVAPSAVEGAPGPHPSRRRRPVPSARTT